MSSITVLTDTGLTDADGVVVVTEPMTSQRDRTPADAPGAREARLLDDTTLVVRARDGDVRAFEELLRRYQDQIYRLAWRMLGNAAEAEDLVQEVFLAAWRGMASLQAEAAFAGWLYRLAVNRCLNALRGRRSVAELDPLVLRSTRSDEQPEQAAEVDAQISALNAALRRLTPPQRACWLLREVHGCSYEEIAEILDTSATAVRGRIARARAILAEVMRPWR